MKAINLMLLLVLFPISILAQGGGGDADGGGGPDNTITMLSANGMDKGIYKDLLTSMKQKEFSNELIKNSGFNDIWMTSKFKGVNFHKNGSFTFQFEKQKKSIGPLPSGISKETLDKSIAEYIQRAEKAEKERKHYIQMRNQYGEEALIDTLDEVINATGAQVQIEAGGYLKIKELHDLQREDIKGFLEKGKLNVNLHHLTKDWSDGSLLETPTQINDFERPRTLIEFSVDELRLRDIQNLRTIDFRNLEDFSDESLFGNSLNNSFN